MKAAGYYRVSTSEQADDGYGLDVQRDKVRAMATVKGWEIVREFTDEGLSGTKDELDRPGLAELTEAIAKGEVEAVIVGSLDRLGRSTRLVLRIVDKFDGAGVELVSCKEALDTSTSTGRFVLRMFASLAELERDAIVERTTAGRDRRGLKDGERGGAMPLGYQRTDQGIEIDPAGAERVRFIFARRAAGATLAGIAAELNTLGHRTQRGKPWHASSVRWVLGNERKYKGGYRWESKVRWPVIIER